MASVPNTNTFSFADVCSVLYGSPSTSGRNLNQCFVDALDSKFDSNYKSSKNGLMNFRNYNYVTKISNRIYIHQVTSRSFYFSSDYNITTNITISYDFTNLDDGQINGSFITMYAGTNTTGIQQWYYGNLSNPIIISVSPESDDIYSYIN